MLSFILFAFSALYCAQEPQSGELSLNEQFIAAAENNNLARVKKLLKAGAEVNCERGKSMLCAMHYNNVRMVSFLIKKGARPFFVNDFIYKIRFLADGASVKIQDQHIDGETLFLTLDAAQLALDEFTSNKCDAFLKDSRGSCIKFLQKESTAGFFSKIKAGLQQKSVREKKSLRIAYWLILHHADGLELLLDSKFKDILITKEFGGSPLIDHAIECDNFLAFKLLLAAGAVPSAKSLKTASKSLLRYYLKHNGSLSKVVYLGSLQQVKQLVDHGAKISAEVIKLAAEHNQDPEVVVYLLAKKRGITLFA